MFEPADWKELPAAVARIILEQLQQTATADEIAPIEIQAESVALPFYARWALVRLRIRRPDREAALTDVFALWREGAAILLDGSSGPVHAANEDETLSLRDEQVADYLRFFCFAVRSASGPFLILERAVPHDGAEHAEAAALARPLAPMGRDSEGNLLFQATVVHVGTAFHAVFSISAAGIVVMVDDDPVLDGFPLELLPRVPDLPDAEAIDAFLSAAPDASAVASMPAPSTVPPGDPAIERAPAGAGQSRASKPAITEMVELLLGKALESQSRNRLIEHFNAMRAPAGPLDHFAALMMSASPVVVVETSIPFVEEVIASAMQARAKGPWRMTVCTPRVDGDDGRMSFSLPLHGPAVVLIPLQVYSAVAQVERVAFEIATRDLAAIVTCERFARLPECLRRITDLVLRLPDLSADDFEVLFEHVLGKPVPPSWREGGTQWLRHLEHVDFEHPRRMRLPPDKALHYVRSQVLERMTAVDPVLGLSLGQLHGLGEARQFAEDLIADIHAAAARTIPWSQVDRGALLVGPPGTGKTTLARAIAKDCGVRFIVASAAGWQAEGVSLGPHIAAIRRTFAEARSYAPSILFIDEIDSIGNREEFAGSNNSIYQTEVVNAVLEQMQGLDESAPVIVIGATNHEGRVDSALRRSGRLDRVIRIPRPNAASLARIYEHYLAVLAAHAPVGAEVDPTALGRLSLGLTGADVERIVRGAARRARKAGRPLAQADVMGEITNKPRQGSVVTLSQEELQRTAIHEAGHAIASFLGHAGGTDIGFVTIIPRDDGTLGFVAPLADERVYLTRRDYEEKLDVCMAGRAAEELEYGADGVSSGASSDLQAATALAGRIVTRLGLGGGARSLVWRSDVGPGDADAVNGLLSASYERVLARLRANAGRLRELAAELVARQELTGEDIRKLLGG